jgi:hypothetical protein
MCGEHFEKLFVVYRQIQSEIGHNVVADIQHALDCQLQIALGVAVDERILDESLLVRLAMNFAEQRDVLTNFRYPGIDNESINQ